VIVTLHAEHHNLVGGEHEQPHVQTYCSCTIKIMLAIIAERISARL